MTIGEKIKRVRTFRGLTQRDLGLKLGYEERNADVRIAQYESGYRIPRKETLIKMASVLNINHVHFTGLTLGCPEEIIIAFLWLEEENRNLFHLFELEHNPENTNTDPAIVTIGSCVFELKQNPENSNTTLNKTATSPHNSSSQTAQNPIGIWIDYDSINQFMREWMLHKEQLNSNEISEADYFEWKINWPNTNNKKDDYFFK